jgi:hypothetical protein
MYDVQTSRIMYHILQYSVRCYSAALERSLGAVLANLDVQEALNREPKWHAERAPCQGAACGSKTS